MVNRAWMLMLLVAALAAWAVLAGANLYWGDLNQDEGWYLYAAGQVLEGKLPYRDYAFTQGPVLPVVYTLAAPLVERCGLAGGRLFTAAVGFLVLLGSLAMTVRLAPAGSRLLGAVLLAGLLGVNVYHSYFTTIVKTYALCSLFLVVGLLMVLCAASRRGALWGFLGGVVLALAAGVRLSAGFALPVAFFYLWTKRRAAAPASWLTLAFGGALGGLLFFGPFFLAAPEGILFGLFRYHTERQAGGELFSILAFKAGFISRLVQAYFVMFVAAVALLVARVCSPDRGKPEDAMPWSLGTGLLWWVLGVITLVHVAAPFPYDDYQVVVAPLFAVAVSVGWCRWLAARAPTDESGRLQRMPAARAVATLIVLASGMAAGSSPLNQAWFVRGQDRVWWRLKEQSAICQLREAADVLRQHAPAGSVLLTQDTYLAVEGRFRVPPGLEMGPFSYFPDYTDERAAALHVVNRAGMRSLLASTDAPVAALSGYSLAIACPEVEELPREEQAALRERVEERYEHLRTWPAFGQAHSPLEVYVRRAAEETSD